MPGLKRRAVEPFCALPRGVDLRSEIIPAGRLPRIRRLMFAVISQAERTEQ